MNYIVDKDATAMTYVDIDGQVECIDAGTLFFSMCYEESEFGGYELCDCCGNMQAVFTVDKHTDEQGRNVHYYVKVNAEHVVECA